MTYDELQALLTQADEAAAAGNLDLAEQCATEALTHLDSFPAEEGESAVESPEKRVQIKFRALLLLGKVCILSGNFPAALEHFAAAQAAAETATDKSKIAKAMNGCVTVYVYLGSYDKALEYYAKALSAHGELFDKSEVAVVTGNIGTVYYSLGSYAKALEYLAKALATHEELGQKSFVARVTGHIGNVYYSLGSYAKGLEYFAKALAAHEELGEKPFVASVTGNIGTVYHSLGSYDKALEYFAKALATHEELGEKSSVAVVTGNIGIVHRNLGSYDKALEYFAKALAAHEELGQKSSVASVTGNIGAAYFALKEYAKALDNHKRALALAEEIGDRRQTGYSMAGIGQTLSALGKKQEAMEYLQKALHLQREELQTNAGVAGTLVAIGVLLAEQNKTDEALEKLAEGLALAEELGEKAEALQANKELAVITEKSGKALEAFDHFKKFYELEKEVLSEEAKKTAQRHEIERQAVEREKEIAIAKAAADAKHQATQELLHNVLPPSIAYRMLEGEKLIAEKLPSVSVLFADIVGFTKLSQRISPEELVEGLDRIFSAFDVLAEKHGLEKIKTIGDAYMVVSGAPIQREDHAEVMAHFALEMVEAIKEFKAITTGEEIQLRIGIHSGEVVAGVIGKKKFAYDLWGDAVNTASRMESHGEAGKIHCTEEFVRALSLSFFQSFQSFKFVERGEMDIKGKGMMKTYYLQKANL